MDLTGIEMEERKEDRIKMKGIEKERDREKRRERKRERKKNTVNNLKVNATFLPHVYWTDQEIITVMIGSQKTPDSFQFKYIYLYLTCTNKTFFSKYNIIYKT